jgi:hypothetical protein
MRATSGDSKGIQSLWPPEANFEYNISKVTCLRACSHTKRKAFYGGTVLLRYRAGIKNLYALPEGKSLYADRFLVLAALAAGLLACGPVGIGGFFFRRALFRQKTPAATTAVQMRMMRGVKATFFFVLLAHGTLLE